MTKHGIFMLALKEMLCHDHRDMSKLSDREVSNLLSRIGRVGAKARAAKLTKKQRSAIAKKAAAARWSKLG
jgi:hypothetical protein